jgi:hypothetical protein
LLTALFFSAATLNLTQCSDLQGYAGMQFRVEQTFIDLVKDEFFYELPYIFNDVIAPIIPK